MVSLRCLPGSSEILGTFENAPLNAGVREVDIRWFVLDDCIEEPDRDGER
jgi:hypothetical protein